MTAYYNEHDAFAAQWLRNLIAAGMIAPGDVDERSIEDVVPVELAKYNQCHFFAGIGVWSYGMRLAGWPDSRRAWTGSCPCQPFSQAGQGAGFADERHLWPAFFHLIEQCRPDIVFGEQVASPDGYAWLDLVQTDMEGADYAFGALVTPAAGYGAPHIRHRTYWMANADGAERWPQTDRGPIVLGQASGWDQGANWPRECCPIGGVANNNNNEGLEGRSGVSERTNQRIIGAYGLVGGMEHPNVSGQDGRPPSGQQQVRSSRYGADENSGAGPTNGFWRDVDWLGCRDEQWRPVEPGTFPLAHGVANRMGLLRGYGNAVNAKQVQAFIEVAIQYAP